MTFFDLTRCLLMCFVCLGSSVPTLAADVTHLASKARASYPVIIGEKATPRVKAAADTLAKYLGQISDAKFAINVGDGKSGIAVGLAADFPGVTPDGGPFDLVDPTRREDYILRSHPTGVQVIGATEIAVEHAVWDLLYRLGYRQFFPGEKWEIVAHTPELSIGVQTREHPSYYSRRIWYGFGAWDYAAGPYADWNARNRASGAINLATGHAYDGIISANKAAFAEHPEYRGLVNGQRTSSKLCISNADLRKLVVQNALRQIDKNPATDSVSVDPSDGGGWCECPECAKLGSITDRALLLANDVAKGINAKYPGKLVGMYAYNYHSPPPSIQADEHVVISVATAFLKGGQSLEEIMAGWSAKTKMLGIREYYSVNTWDRDMPAAARGGNIAYLKRTIPQFHEKGARFMSAESSDNWGPNGLGYYLSSRMLWNVEEAKNIDVLIEDFLTRAFGPAKEPMREYYKQLDGSEAHLAPSDQVGRMFRALDEARKLTKDPAIRSRLDDLVQYARYVDLYSQYSKAQGAERQTTFEALIRHTYRMRRTMLVHAKALYRDLAGRDKSVTIPTEAKWNVADGKNPWKSSDPFTEGELAKYLAEGIERYPLSKVDFKPVVYSDDLVPATKLNPPEIVDPKAIGSLGAGRGKQVFHTRVDTVPAEIELLITGGMIAHYRDRGNVKIELWKIGGESQTGERDTLISQDRSVPPNGNEHAVKLAVKQAGVYRITIDDGMDRTLVKWNSKLPVAVKSSADEPMNKHYTDLWQMYFYVPKGTQTIGFFGGEHGELRDSHGRPVFWLNGREPNYYSTPVPAGEDGAFWQVRYGRGPIRLLTVPPYFARTPAELLLPKEVVK